MSLFPFLQCEFQYRLQTIIMITYQKLLTLQIKDSHKLQEIYLYPPFTGQNEVQVLPVKKCFLTFLWWEDWPSFPFSDFGTPLSQLPVP